MCAFSANLLGEVCVSVGVGGRALARHYEAALPTALLGNQEALAGILFHRAQRHIALSLTSPRRTARYPAEAERLRSAAGASVISSEGAPLQVKSS